jgi:hypothetical protein
MIKKDIIINTGFSKIDGKEFKMSTTEEVYEYEPISKNICCAIDDFYNLMHLIKNSWINTNYILKQRNAGYDIYSKDKKLNVWLGVIEKSRHLFFVIYYNDHNSDIWDKAERGFKGPKEVYDFDEDNWIYNKILLSEIFKEDNDHGQRKILEDWINETIKNIL